MKACITQILCHFNMTNTVKTPQMFAAINVRGFDLWTHSLPLNFADLNRIIIMFNIMSICLFIVIWQTLLAYTKHTVLYAWVTVYHTTSSY